MNATYKFVEMIKAKRNIASDYAVGKLVSVTSQKISSWKANASEANALHTLKLIDAAGITVKEAIDILEERQPQQKKLFSQDGFASLSLIFVTALLSILVLASSVLPHTVYYVKLSNKIKSKLLRFAHHNQMQSICVYLLKTC